MMGHKDVKMAEIHTQVKIRLRKATARHVRLRARLRRGKSG